MNKFICLCSILIIVSFTGCKKTEVLGQKKINSIVINTIDYINGTPYPNTTQFIYHYENDILKEISNNGLKHITFEYSKGKVIAKKYFNNLEEVINIDSFFYDSMDKLSLIKRNNSAGFQVQRFELIYDLDKLSDCINTRYYPNTSSEYYHFTYSGSNIDSASLISGNIHYSYSFEYYTDANKQDLQFFIDGLYIGGTYGFDVTTLPVMFSTKSIKLIRGYDELGVQNFKYEYEHLFEEDRYKELHIKWFDKNLDILNSTIMQFQY